MAWNWYPTVAQDTAKLPPRLHGHADMDIITLLYQRTGTQKHLPSAETRFYCAQRFLSLVFHCRNDVSELEQTSWD